MTRKEILDNEFVALVAESIGEITPEEVAFLMQETRAEADIREITWLEVLEEYFDNPVEG